MQPTALPAPRARSAQVLDLLGAPAVVPPERRSRRATLVDAPHPLAARRARGLVTEAYRCWGLPGQAYAAVLVADELVTNAVLHARTLFELHVLHLGDAVQLAVHDRDPAFCLSWWDSAPTSEDIAGGHQPHGARYGLGIVRDLAERVGCYGHPDGGKVMWALLAVGPSGGATTVDLASRKIVRGAGGPNAGTRTAEVPAPVRGQGTVRRTVLVNGVRRRRAPGRPGWRLELLLGWQPEAPDWVDLTLRGTPLHPSLPQGHWRVRRDALRRGLDRPAADAGVRLHPDPTGRVVLLDLEGPRARVVHVPARDVLDFLDETGGSLASAEVGVPESPSAMGIPAATSAQDDR